MTFEEFFKKKRIDVDALEKGNPALLFEFKNHFEQMGEKSFDHTKKYWFNKLRLQYHLAPEVKTEKVKMENPLAEQTVTDSLAESRLSEPRSTDNSKFEAAPLPDRPATDQSPAAANKGFTPRFKAGATRPATPPAAEENKPEEAATTDKPKVGFTPRFKAGVTKSTEEATSSTDDKKPDEPVASDKPKVGFTPRFKAGVTKPAEPTPSPDGVKPEESAASDKPKGFTPRFKAGVTKAAEPVDLLSEGKKEPADTPSAEEIKPEEAPAQDKPKIGFTPRFKASAPPKRQDPPTEE